MRNATVARQNGDDYQSRHFWIHALKLLDEESLVAKVTLESDGDKGFDDIVIHYDPPMGQTGAKPLKAEFQQIKWQSTMSRIFGYEDLIKTSFIRSKTRSLLGHLKHAIHRGDPQYRYKFVTTAHIKDGDPLRELISNENGLLRVDKLAKGKFARVLDRWKEPLEISDDEEMVDIVRNLSIHPGQPNMEEMKEIVNEKAKSVGVMQSFKTSDFRFDSLARQLLKNGTNTLTKELLTNFFEEQKVKYKAVAILDKEVTQVAIFCFNRLTTDISIFESENLLSLENKFHGRYLNCSLDWNKHIAGPVSEFLKEKVRSSNKLRLTLDAHASVALVAGTVIDLKSGVYIELVQNGIEGKKIWQASDNSGGSAGIFNFEQYELGSGMDVALAVSVSNSTVESVRHYIEVAGLDVGFILECKLPKSPDHDSICGGRHASKLSHQIVEHLRSLKLQRTIETVHIFAAVPNSFMFYLGQQIETIGKFTMYEFDLEGNGTNSYTESVVGSRLI